MLREIAEAALEWGASVRVVDYTFAQTAVVTATEPGYGPISVHAALGHQRKWGGKLAFLQRLEARR